MATLSSTEATYRVVVDKDVPMRAPYNKSVGMALTEKRCLRLEVSLSNFPRYDRNPTPAASLASITNYEPHSKRSFTISVIRRIWCCR